MRLLCLLLLLFIVPAKAQEYWHRVTGSVGFFIPASGSDTEGFGVAPVIGVDYGFRFHRHGQFDAGVDLAPSERYTRGAKIWIPRVGYSGVIPLFRDRIEVILGGGGAYSFFNPEVTQQSWLIYLQGGGNYALDREGRYRAGIMTRWYRDVTGAPQQQWVSLAGTISYNWGR